MQLKKNTEPEYQIVTEIITKGMIKHGMNRG